MRATKEEIKVNKNLTLQKWGRRWQNTKSNMYKILIPNLTSDGLKQRALHLSFTTRNGASKIVRLKLGHCFFNYHKSKFDSQTVKNVTARKPPYTFFLIVTNLKMKGKS